MRRRHSRILPNRDVPVSPYTLPADRYLGCPQRHGRDLAFETVTQAIDLATAKPPRILLNIDDDPAMGDAVDCDVADLARTKLGFDPWKTTTRLELSDGSTIEHLAWCQSFHGWVSEVWIRGGLHGDCKVEIMTRERAMPIGLLPDLSSPTRSMAAAMLTLHSARLHLELSMNAPQHESGDALSGYVAEAETAAAHADAPESDDMVHVVHAAPWAPIRAIDSEPYVDLLDEEAYVGLPALPTRLFVSADADGGSVVVERLSQFADVPDPLSRLRTLAATTRRADA